MWQLSPTAQKSILPPMSETNLRPIFICGCPRSGTTLLGAMLGGHPQYAAVPEAQWLVPAVNRARAAGGNVDAAKLLRGIERDWRFRLWEIETDAALVEGEDVGVAELTRRIVRRFAQQRGRANPLWWIDHTPEHVRFLSRLFEVFPGARAVHLVRDGRAVAASVMPLDWGPNTIIRAANWWAGRVGAGVAAECHFAENRIVRMRYEKLVQSPASSLRWLCEQLDLEYHEAMAGGGGFEVPAFTKSQHALVGAGVDASRIDRWKSKLSARQIELFEFVTGDLLQYLGFGLVSRADAPPPGRWERLRDDLGHVLRSQLVDRFRLRRRRAQ